MNKSFSKKKNIWSIFYKNKHIPQKKKIFPIIKTKNHQIVLNEM